MEKEKLLILTSTFPTFTEKDSTPTFVYEFAKSISQINDFEIIVLTPYRKNSKLYEEKERIKIHRFKYGTSSLCDGAILSELKKNKLLWFTVPFFFLSYIYNLKKIVKKENIKTIHAHWIIPQGLVAIICKKIFFPKIKIIGTIHGSDIEKIKNARLKKIILKNLDYLTVVSNDLKNKVDELGLKNLKIETIPMGVDSERFNPNNYDEQIKKKYDIRNFFLLFVGRLSDEKGVKYLLQAMPEVIKHDSGIKLLIAGDGPLKNDLQKKSDDLGISKNVLFLGKIPNNKLPPYFATADIFIGPSTREGFGLVFVEALLSKTCVISSDLKTISDIVINEETGVQTNAKDAQKFSNAIIDLMLDKEQRERLSEKGYEHTKNNFSSKIISSKYNNLFKKFLYEF